MAQLLNKCKKYLKENLAVEVQAVRWKGEKRLPLLFRDRYDFFRCELLGVPHLFMIAKGDHDTTPASIRKHVEKVVDLSAHEVIYVAAAMAAYNRKRLIEYKVSFVVPDNQMYLPKLGVDLREHIRKVREPEGKQFSPSTQAAVLHAIYFGAGIENEVSPLELATELGYTKMTLSRVFDELEALELADIEMRGRERMLRFPMDGEELWNRAKSFMRSPVKRIVDKAEPLQDITNELLAGESALSKYTMLAAPSRPVHAMITSMWKCIYPSRKDEPRQLSADESVTVEIWAYMPLTFCRPGCVDPLSLYLSVGETENERVEAAREELLKWRQRFDNRT